MSSNKIILISSYCDNEEKLEILKNNILVLKNLGLDVMLNSPIDIPNNISSLCDFYIRTKENPVMDWPDKCVYTWSDYQISNTRIRVARSLPDYGWANIYQVKKLSEYALTYDYEYFYHIIYDLKIDDIVLSGLLSDNECNFYHFHEHWTSLHFMLFNRENLLRFLPNLNIRSYLDFGGIAESWLKHVIENSDLPYVMNDEYVDDYILFHRGIDLFNYSDFDEFKYFISKNSLGYKNIEIYFYELSEPIDISVHIDSTVNNYIVKDRDIIDIGFMQDQFENIKIEYNNKINDITKKIISITHNNIEIYEED